MQKIENMGESLSILRGFMAKNFYFITHQKICNLQIMSGEKAPERGSQKSRPGEGIFSIVFPTQMKIVEPDFELRV